MRGGDEAVTTKSKLPFKIPAKLAKRVKICYNGLVIASKRLYYLLGESKIIKVKERV
jgi:hypothetical protein